MSRRWPYCIIDAYLNPVMKKMREEYRAGGILVTYAAVAAFAWRAGVLNQHVLAVLWVVQCFGERLERLREAED